MNVKQLLISTLVVGVLANVFDGVLFGVVFKSTLDGIAGANNDPSLIVWYISSDFALALILAWFYGIVRGSFSSGAKFGMVTGIVVSFPMQLVMGAMIKGWPLWFSVVGTIISIAEFTIYGLLIGLLNKPKAA